MKPTLTTLRPLPFLALSFMLCVLAVAAARLTGAVRDGHLGSNQVPGVSLPLR